jgi:hypothetical protein
LRAAHLFLRLCRCTFGSNQGADALGNALRNDRLRAYLEPAIAPVRRLVGQEEFTAGG